MDDSELRRGDLVEVRTPAEILHTLDSRGRFNELPFMPEMIDYCGRRFTVDRRADKLCDTIASLKSRRIPDAVLLDDLRCDGSGHGGCQAECRFYWKSAWLKRVQPGDPPTAEVDDPAAIGTLNDVAAQRHDHPLRRHSRVSLPSDRDGGGFQRALDIRAAPVSPGVSVRERLVDHVRPCDGEGAVVQPLHRTNLLPVVPVKGPSSKSPEAEPLDLQTGDWVRVQAEG